MYNTVLCLYNCILQTHMYNVSILCDDYDVDDNVNNNNNNIIKRKATVGYTLTVWCITCLNIIRLFLLETTHKHTLGQIHWLHVFQFLLNNLRNNVRVYYINLYMYITDECNWFSNRWYGRERKLLLFTMSSTFVWVQNNSHSCILRNSMYTKAFIYTGFWRCWAQPALNRGITCLRSAYMGKCWIAP